MRRLRRTQKKEYLGKTSVKKSTVRKKYESSDKSSAYSRTLEVDNAMSARCKTVLLKVKKKVTLPFFLCVEEDATFAISLS